MFERAALIHYHEIGLKGRNRSSFEKRLRDNLALALLAVDGIRAERISSRLLVRTPDSAVLEEVVSRVSVIPGVSSVSPCWITSRELSEMCKASSLAIADSGEYRTFAVEARRSNTDHPMNSMEMNRAIGRHLVDETAKRVDLSNPDVTVRVEVVQGDAYIYSRKLPGPGGLPVGTGGKVVALLSAGIDSPVATWRLAKRGAVPVGIHFSGRPQVSASSERLVAEIGSVLERRGAIARIYIVPFGDLQKEISLHAPPDLRVLLYRRLMVRVAEELARIEGAKALVTGESLGQVASQTLENMVVVDDAATMPILRPLVGSDKVEIIAEARNLATFDLSTQEHDDCCTLFMPRTPATHATVEEIHQAEESLDMRRMTGEALESMTYLEYRCPSYKAPRTLPASVTAVAEPAGPVDATTAASGR